jgi:hypothetical protein
MRRLLHFRRQAASTTSTPLGSTPTLTLSPGENTLAAELAIWALITEPSGSAQ